MQQNTVFLFDVDGVLVEPVAYKLGLQKSIEILSGRIGLRNADCLMPQLSEIAYMESRGIHDVWDMCALSFALILARVYARILESGVSIKLEGTELDAWLGQLRQTGVSIDRPDYTAFAGKVSTTQSSKHPPEQALIILSNEMAESELKETYKNLLKAFLSDTRSPLSNYSSRLFQNIILGEDTFSSSYGIPSQYSGEALLKSKDRVLLDPDLAEKIMELQDSKTVNSAIYTARPSRAPSDVLNQRACSPEAEIAAESCGLARLPLAGMGMMDWLASRHGRSTVDLTKPNTTHAFAALMAALERRHDSQTIAEAYRLSMLSTEELSAAELGKFRGCRTDVYVFEDTVSGIRPLLTLQERLQAAGCRIEIHPIGIAFQANKVSALQSLCQKLYLQINDALKDTLRSLSLI